MDVTRSMLLCAGLCALIVAGGTGCALVPGRSAEVPFFGSSEVKEAADPGREEAREAATRLPGEVGDGLFADEQERLATLSTGYRLRVGDSVEVHLRGIRESANYNYVIDDSGYIHLPYIPPIRALGQTASQLQRRIRDTYIEEQIYRRITVNVILPMQHYFVRGEIRQPGRFPLTSGITITQAIAAAGGYTEYANPRRVEIIRGGETIEVNARDKEQNPELDREVKVGDVIIVRRSIF